LTIVFLSPWPPSNRSPLIPEPFVGDDMDRIAGMPDSYDDRGLLSSIGIPAWTGS
jgi:hypothetical protein